MSDVASPEQEIRPPLSFKEVLLQSAFSKGRAISDSVSEIDLGVFGQEGRGLVFLMMKDLQHREFGKLVYVLKDRRVLLQDQPTMGEEESTTYSFKTNILIDNSALPWFMRQDKMLGTSLHSHPEDIPPSSEDLLQLLIVDSDYMASAAVFVSTLQRNFVIFRGTNAPQFTRDQVREKIALWEKSIEGRVMEFTNPRMSTPQRMEVNNKARMVLLRQIGQKYDLRIFFGEATTGKVTLLP